MLTKDPSVFRNSQQPKELVNMARVYAASEDPQDHSLLLAQLNSTDFLARLNSEDDYLRLPPRALNVARVVKTLMDQPHPVAHDTLVGLTAASNFQSFVRLVELNIQALAVDRPARAQTLAYWNTHSTPESSNIDLVIEAAFENQSPPALQFVGNKINDPAQDDDRKLTWLRDQLLRRRNDLNVLRFSEAMLVSGGLSRQWHDPLLEALFDYNEHWYLACACPQPPNRLAAGPEAKQAMGRIGDHALQRMQIFIPGLTAKIRAAMELIGHDSDQNAQS